MAMATTDAGENSITSPADAAGGTVSGEVLLRMSSDSEERESSAEQARRKLKGLNKMVFCIALLEWAGNAVGTLALLWATVVLLGGFSSLLISLDFWVFTVMIFMESTRVFIRNDASVNQWLLGSTRAFRWDHFRFSDMHDGGNAIAFNIGAGISLAPIELGSQIITGIIKVAILAITSQLLARRRWNLFVKTVISLLLLAGVAGGYYGFYEMSPHKFGFTLANVRFTGIYLGWLLGTWAAQMVTYTIMMCIVAAGSGSPKGILLLKLIVASGLVCLPLLQAKLGSKYKWLSISIAAALLTVNLPEIIIRELEQEQEQSSPSNRSTSGEAPPPEQEEISNTLLLGTWQLLLKMVGTIMPILFFWGVMFPLPGISLKVSFYMLLSVVAAVLVGNLQIPVAFLQILLSSLRLHSLLSGHHHHRDYHPLPDGASPNLVPSIEVFYILVLCQGSSYVVATILGLISFQRRRSLVRDLGFTKDWGARAVNLYYHQAYQARAEEGLFPSEKYTPSLTSFAIQSLGCTSSEIQIVGLRILDNFLEKWDSRSRNELITEITSTFHKAAVSSLVDMLKSTVEDISLLAARIIDRLTSDLKISEFPGIVKLVCSLLDVDNRQDSLPNKVPEDSGGNLATHQRTLFSLLAMSILHGLSCDSDNCVEISQDATTVITKIVMLVRYFDNEENIDEKRKVYCSALKLVRSFVINSGKVGETYRQELLENPFLMNILEHILHLEDCEPEAVMDIIAKLALDEAARQEIGSSQAVVGKLVCAFLMPYDGANSSANNGLPLRMAAGEALANLTIMSTDNCWAILLAEAEAQLNLVVNLIDMLDNECYICVAANLLHNLCGNSGDKLVELGKQHLESAVQKVMEIIMTSEGKQLEAALSVASQIGYVIPEYYSQVLESKDTNSAVALVEKLLHTLSSIREPCLEYPRIRRVLVEVVISIADLCPLYINIFREKRAKNSLDMVKGTPSRLEKCRAFLDGKGVVAESLPMRDLVDKAKRLIY